MFSYLNCCSDINNIKRNKNKINEIIDIKDTYEIVFDIEKIDFLNIITLKIMDSYKKDFNIIQMNLFNNSKIYLIVLYNLEILKLDILFENLNNKTKLTIHKNWGDNNIYNIFINYLLSYTDKLTINTGKHYNIREIIYNIKINKYSDKILNAKVLAVYCMNGGFMLHSNLLDIIQLLNTNIQYVEGYICIALVYFFKNNKTIDLKKYIKIIEVYKNKLINLENYSKNIIITNNTEEDCIIRLFMSNNATKLLNLINNY